MNKHCNGCIHYSTAQRNKANTKAKLTPEVTGRCLQRSG